MTHNIYIYIYTHVYIYSLQGIVRKQRSTNPFTHQCAGRSASHWTLEHAHTQNTYLLPQQCIRTRANMYTLANVYMCSRHAYHTRIPQHTHILQLAYWYEVVSMSRLLKIIGLFCKRALQKRLYSATETCNFKEPPNRSQPVWNVED